MPEPAAKKAPRTLAPGARRTAWLVALLADALQLVALPLFAAGWVSPVNDALDVVVSLVLVRLLGWHPALLPALLAELIPGVDLIPAWTAAVAVATWGRKNPEVAAPAPPPDTGRSHAEVLDDDPPR